MASVKSAIAVSSSSAEQPQARSRMPRTLPAVDWLVSPTGSGDAFASAAWVSLPLVPAGWTVAAVSRCNCRCGCRRRAGPVPPAPRRHFIRRNPSLHGAVRRLVATARRQQYGQQSRRRDATRGESPCPTRKPRQPGRKARKPAETLARWLQSTGGTGDVQEVRARLPHPDEASARPDCPPRQRLANFVTAVLKEPAYLFGEEFHWLPSAFLRTGVSGPRSSWLRRRPQIGG